MVKAAASGGLTMVRWTLMTFPPSYVLGQGFEITAAAQHAVPSLTLILSIADDVRIDLTSW